MKCKQVRELMGAYLYGDLSPTEMREVRMHAHECFECREDLRERGGIIASLGDESPAISDAERQSIAWSVKGAIRQQEQEREYSRSRFSPAYAIVGVLALGLVVGSTINARMHTPGPPAPQQVAVQQEDQQKKTAGKATVEIVEQHIAHGQAKEDDAARIADKVIGAISESVIPAVKQIPSNRNTHNPERDDTIKKDDPVPVVAQRGDGEVKKTGNATQLPKPQDINDARTTVDGANEE